MLHLLKAGLRYDNGTILVTGTAHIPFASVDPRTKNLVNLVLQNAE
jgi:hypothetical protein